MKVTNLKINGITNPVGFAYPRIKCSWQVEDAGSRKQINARITVAEDEGLEYVFLEKEDRNLDSIGEHLKINLVPRKRYYYRVEVTGDNGEHAISDSAYFETGKMNEPWSADFICTGEEDRRHPVFFKDFKLADKKVRGARIYVTGLGLYEAYVNGKRAGNDFLAPFCNDYRKEIQYQTYDITKLLETENTVEIMTGNGWYKGRLGYEGASEVYGNRFTVIAEIHVQYTDGTETVVGTDESWQYRYSDIEMSDIYDGECYNHMLWADGGNHPKTVHVWDDKDNVIVTKKHLKERYSLPVVVKDELAVREVITTPAGETVLDFGQNFTGYVEFQADFSSGTRIVLDHGELLQQGNFYNGNYRTAKAQFIYVSDGRKETVRPHFTYYGFRYVRVTGWEGELDASTFVGKVVYSDLDLTSSIETSSSLLNRLAENCIWGQRSNFLDMPTDCPQRDERLGWTGDAQVFSPTACFNMDTRAFYRKYLHDLRLDQMEHDGMIAKYLPNFQNDVMGAGSVWGDVATFLPMTLYKYYGDREELADNYPMMKDWVERIIKDDVENGERHLWDFGFHFGDWLAQDGISPQSMKGGTDDHYVASIYYYASVLKTAKAAGILGFEEDMKRYCAKAEKIYKAVLEEFFSQNGRLAVDTQTAYLLSLRFHVYMDKGRIIDGLKLRLKKDGYKIKGGFVGATMMCQVLAENGMGDMAYYILFQEGFPGWMHCINLGATTIWERWNSVLDDGSISGTGMNSLNHYSYGSVMEYVYRYIAGISPAEPGFRSVRFAPQLNSRLQYMRYSYSSVSGVYTSMWRINPDGTVTVSFDVPFNCTATVVLPGTDGEEIALETGHFEKTYTPIVDYRKLYNMDTRLEELLNDSRAMKILQEKLPAAYDMAVSGDVENMGVSFNELSEMYFLGFSPEQVLTAAEPIMKLERE